MAFMMNCCVVSVLLLLVQLYSMEAKITRVPRGTFGNNLYESVYFVYMGGVSETTTTNTKTVHTEMLSRVLGSAQAAASSILYSYTKSFNGFAAVLTADHAETIRGMPGVVSVLKSQMRQLHTTASWEFLGLNPDQGTWPESNFGNGSIVGMVDTGVWPESESFNDEGFGPIPSRWKGSCVQAEKWGPENCNKKLIGAKFYSKAYLAEGGTIEPPDYNSTRDSLGHGTHTASTAAGRRVANASFDGVANGTASGGAPLARLAAYKVCWGFGCAEVDILAAMEDAISDGVDLLSISLGAGPTSLLYDILAIGSFHAVQNGIVVSSSAGNSGPDLYSVSNTAPWMLTVGASTINRVYQATVELENGPNVSGIAINTFTLNKTYPMAYGAHIKLANATVSDASNCFDDTLDPKRAEGHIVVCKDGNIFLDSTISDLGGVGFVQISDADQTVQFAAVLPGTTVDSKGGDAILEFINGTLSDETSRAPFGLIDRSVSIFNTVPAPIMAFFSSVGPPLFSLDFLKPDITAPGVDILAAWSPVANPGGEEGDTRTTDFNIVSGTSMSCPHVTGAAALVKSMHPDWSPAAVKSAIMTTATPLNPSFSEYNVEVATGAGQINPTNAVNPGLVFNITTADYVNYLCSLGYNSTQVQLISGGKQVCSDNPALIVDLNYPSIYISSVLLVGLAQNITRTATNVAPSTGPGPTTYTVTVTPPTNVDVIVQPSTLEFTDVNEEKSFNVIFTITNRILGSHNFGSITWNDGGGHSVRMVIGIGVPPF